MHLALLEQALERNTEALRKPRAVLADCFVVVSQMKA
jgi:hypothetical protein